MMCWSRWLTHIQTVTVLLFTLIQLSEFKKYTMKRDFHRALCVGFSFNHYTSMLPANNDCTLRNIFLRLYNLPTHKLTFPYSYFWKTPYNNNSWIVNNWSPWGNCFVLLFSKLFADHCILLSFIFDTASQLYLLYLIKPVATEHLTVTARFNVEALDSHCRDLTTSLHRYHWKNLLDGCGSLSAKASSHKCQKIVIYDQACMTFYHVLCLYIKSSLLKIFKLSNLVTNKWTQHTVTRSIFIIKHV